jgi:hypothetical protein
VTTDSPLPLAIGHWQIASPPPGWEFVPGNGLRFAPPNRFTSNVTFTEEDLPPGKDLKSYVEAQIVVARRYLPNAEFAGPQPSRFPECDETLKLVLQTALDDGSKLVQGQVYVRVRNSVGVLTCTSTSIELPQVQPAMNAILENARFRPPAQQSVEP